MYQVSVVCVVHTTATVQSYFTDAILQIIDASLCSNQQLQCNNVIDNPNPEYQWRHNDNIIAAAAANASLNLFKIKDIDFGLYYCWLKPSPYGTVVTKVLLLRREWFCREIF